MPKIKNCPYCKKDYHQYSTHLRSKKHIKNLNRTNSLKITKEEVKNTNIKILLNELLDPENDNLEWTKNKIEEILCII